LEHEIEQQKHKSRKRREKWCDLFRGFVSAWNETKSKNRLEAGKLLASLGEGNFAEAKLLEGNILFDLFIEGRKESGKCKTPLLHNLSFHVTSYSNMHAHSNVRDGSLYMRIATEVQPVCS
jgi:hypothetical protein